MRGRRAWGVLLGLCLGLLVVVVRHASASGGGDPTAYAFLHQSPAGGPVAYPCGVLHYEISMVDAPPDFAQVVEGAIGRMEAASGYQFAYDGPAPDRNFYAHLVDGWGGPIMIGFANDQEVPGLVGDVIGVGGSALSSDQSRYTTGVIMLDRPFFDRSSSMGIKQAVVMHELGHVLGLGHVKDRPEIMYPTMHGQTALAAGDLAGLQALHRASCGASASSR